MLRGETYSQKGKPLPAPCALWSLGSYLHRENFITNVLIETEGGKFGSYVYGRGMEKIGAISILPSGFETWPEFSRIAFTIVIYIIECGIRFDIFLIPYNIVSLYVQKKPSSSDRNLYSTFWRLNLSPLFETIRT